MRQFRVVAFLSMAMIAGVANRTAAARVAVPADDPFDRGRVLLEAGDIVGALDLWIELRDSLTAVGAEDPRIATAFIASVAEHEIDRYKEMASLMFYWGFSGLTPNDDARREILAEGRRTFALADSVTSDAWSAAGRADPVSLALAIKQFWIERDPTPTTPENERLLEHWSRIAYARENHVYNRSSPFGTDDRGTLYVKYGPPAQVTAGHMKISSAEAEWRGVSRDDLFRWDVEPQYEIWRYTTLNDREFTYFMFGNEEGTGPFRRVAGPHDILPSGSRFGPGSRIATGIRAQYYLELFYYTELARAGGPFGLRLSQLEAIWNQRGGRPNEGYLEAASLRHIDDDVRRAKQPKPLAWSEIDDAPKSAISAQVARVVQDGKPRILVLAVSSPLWTPEMTDGKLPADLALADYVPHHTVIVRDHLLDEIQRAAMQPLDSEGQLATLVLRHEPHVRHLSVAARHDMDTQRRAAARTPPFPGRRHFVVDSPLVFDSTSFEVSDPVVGIAQQAALRPEASPVPLLPATRFWRNDLLRIYFETYRPAGTPAQQSKTYDVRLQVVPSDERFFGHDQTFPFPPAEEEREGRATVSVSVETTGSATKHFLDLDLRNETPGILRLVLDVTDPATGLRRSRVVVVRLLDL